MVRLAQRLLGGDLGAGSKHTMVVVFQLRRHWERQFNRGELCWVRAGKEIRMKQRFLTTKEENLATAEHKAE